MIVYDSKNPEGKVLEPKPDKLSLASSTRMMTAEDWEKYGPINPEKKEARFKNAQHLIRDEAVPFNSKKLRNAKEQSKKTKDLAARIRAVHDRLDITFRGLSKLIGINQTSLMNYEQGSQYPAKRNLQLIEAFLSKYEEAHDEK